MSEVKQILVVDDHFEMLEFLRSMLEMSNQDYQVIGVPSAEEGFLELRRTPFDLLITDVRLPGMSGFELVRRVQNVRPDLPIIMITAYSSTQGRDEAEELGIFRYFQKPLNTDSLLAAVHAALNGKEPEPATRIGRDAVEVEVGAGVRERLRSLRTDTGATQVVLADSQGRIIAQMGNTGDLDVSRLAGIAAEALQSGFRLAEELHSEDPLMIQYQTGATSELYTANIGSDFFVMLLFAVRERRGRIGTIWIFAQRAIRDLKEALPRVIAATAESAQEAEPAPTPDEKETPTGTSIRAAAQEPSLRPAKNEESVADPPEMKGAQDEPGALSDIAEAEVSTEIEEAEILSLEELMADDELAALFGEVELDGDPDLDAFWESALNNREEEVQGEGFSLEEARRRGLIPPELGPAAGEEQPE